MQVIVLASLAIVHYKNNYEEPLKTIVFAISDKAFSSKYPEPSLTCPRGKREAQRERRQQVCTADGNKKGDIDVERRMGKKVGVKG